MSTQDRPELQSVIPQIPGGEEYHETKRQFQGIPGIERTPCGRLFASWYSGGATECEKNYVLLSQSDDDGVSWVQATVVIDPADAVRAFDPVLWIDPRGRLWFFWSQAWQGTGGMCGVWAMRCDMPDAQDLSWTEPRRLCNGIMMNKPTVYNGFDWLIPAAVWRKHAPIEELKPEQHSNVIVSEDEGESWSLRGAADVPMSDCDEHMLIERRDGSLWMLVRTDYGIGQSISRDGGVRWSPGWPSEIPSPVSRFHIRRLQSGRLLLVTHAYSVPDRRHPGKRPTRSHLCAYLSEDDGRTWSGGLMIDERLDVSYPDATQAASGEIYVIYDRDRFTAGEILMAEFTEEDVLCGAFRSLHARERVLISRMHKDAVGETK